MQLFACHLEFFVTNHSALSRSGDFGISFPVGIILIYDASGIVSVF
jgi:hypothetical protein